MPDVTYHEAEHVRRAHQAGGLSNDTVEPPDACGPKKTRMCLDVEARAVALQSGRQREERVARARTYNRSPIRSNFKSLASEELTAGNCSADKEVALKTTGRPLKVNGRRGGPIDHRHSPEELPSCRGGGPKDHRHSSNEREPASSRRCPQDHRHSSRRSAAGEVAL